MEIITNKNNDVIEISLKGRLDTVSSSQLASSFNYDLSGIKEVVFNFKDLEYISSAGLRCVLDIDKKVRKTCKMKIINISGYVREVFEITGFIDIFDID